MTATNTLIIGCGNLLCGDDAAGPTLVRRLEQRGLPAGVRCIDAGTGGIDVALRMRGVPEVILVDACRSGAEPGSLFEVPAAEIETLPPLSGVTLHAVRWNHAVACGRQLLGPDYPPRVSAFLVEGRSFEPGSGISPPVCRAVETLADLLLARCGDRDLAPH
jgi:hydrogenase maturation protease